MLRDSWLVSIIMRTNPPSLNINDQAEVMSCKRFCSENESKKVQSYLNLNREIAGQLYIVFSR